MNIDALSISRILSWVCLILILRFTPCPSQINEFPSDDISERITVEDGISSNIATRFLRDSKGFMWIGTDRGLNRYDGYDFKTFIHSESDSTSISDDHIVCLSEDSEGNIWIGTFYGGLNKYEPDTETFTRYPEDTDDPYGLRHAAIWAVCATSEGEVWFSAINDQIQSIFKIEPVTDEISFISPDPINTTMPADIHCHVIYEDSMGVIWAGAADCLIKYDTLINDFIEIHNYHPGIKRTTSEISSIAEDRKGNLWISEWKYGLYKFNLNTNQFINHYNISGDTDSVNNNTAYEIYELSDGHLILRSGDGINFFNPGSELFTSWDFDNHHYGIVANSAIHGLYLDNSGVLWFGVPPGSNRPTGIYRTNLDKSAFNHFSPGELLANGLASRWISSICEDHRGDIWLGGQNTGLIKIENPYSVPSIKRYRANPEDPFSISSNNISAIYQDYEGSLWVGCWEEGILHKYENSGDSEVFRKYKQYDHFESGRIANPADAFRYNDQSWDYTGAGCMRIYEDSKNRLWIGRGTGLELFDRDNESFFSYELDPDNIKPHKYPIITAIEEGRTGSLWIGTMDQGLIKLIPPFTIGVSEIPGGKNTVQSNNIRITAGGLNDEKITALCIPKVNEEIALWVGTWGRGLYGLVNRTENPGEDDWQIVHYATNDGLPDDVVLGIHEDDIGNLWVNTEKGLSKFNPHTSSFNSYDISDGMMIERFHWFSNHKGKTGHIIFAGAEGLIAYHPDQILENPAIPPIAITGFQLFNQQVPIGKNSPLKKAITETTEIELSYQENYLTFEFTALNFINTGKNLYKYMMEGLDKDWINAGTQRLASYSNLKHGKYTFTVKGSNNDGIWNEEGRSIRIIIHPPPWLAWWAYCIYSLLIIGIILWYRNYLLNRAKLQTAYEIERIEKEKVQELDTMKSRFFANISHEFRTPLTLITGPINELMKESFGLNASGKKLLSTMKRNSQRLMQLINQLLELSKLETGKMKLEVSEGDLSGFLRSIFMAFLSLAEKNKICYESDIEETPDHICFDKDKVEKIITNLISNALKFTQEGGSIAVKVSYLLNKADGSGIGAEIVIKDTGPGIPVEEREKIFEQFHQVSSSDNRSFEGSGIGLALTKELVELYRGEIQLESEIGQGSTFSVTLPASMESFKEDEFIISQKALVEIPDSANEDSSEHIVENLTQKDAVRKYDNDKPLILVVEDNPDLRDYISQNLLLDYQILEAENGRLGLQKATESIPDLVISDLMMPEMDGIEMCEKLKSDHRTSHIPLIMLTAKADKTSKMESLETGADDYILKPFDAEELQARVRNLIEQRKRLRERYRKEFLTDPGIASLTEPVDGFLEKVISCLEKNLSDSEYNVQQLGQDVGLSQSQLYRKMLALSDLTPSEFIRNTRLKMAARMFNEGHKNVSVVLYAVGFNTPSRFSQYFRELFRVNPSEYIRKTALKLD